MPRLVAQAVGLRVEPATVRALRLVGARELAVAALFLWRGSPPWLWGFVAQDVMDLPVLWWALGSRHVQDRHRLGRVRVAYLGLAAVDVFSAVTRNSARRTARNARASRDVAQDPPAS